MTEKEIEDKLVQFKKGLELFKSKLDEVRKENQEFEEKNNQVLQLADLLKAENTKLTSENNQEKEKNQKFEKEIKNYKNKINELTDHNKNIEVMLKNQIATVNADAEENYELKEKISKLNEQVKQLKSSLVTLEKKPEEKKPEENRIVSLPANKLTTSTATHHYNIGTTSENVMQKFINVIREIHTNNLDFDGSFILKDIFKAGKTLNIIEDDIAIISQRLKGMHDPEGKPLIFVKDGELHTKLNLERFINWISFIKE